MRSVAKTVIRLVLPLPPARGVWTARRTCLARLGWLACTPALLLAGGCSTPSTPGFPSTSGITGRNAQRSFSGRLALRLVPPGQDQALAFSAAFELSGSPQAGELALRSPVGSTLALLQWQPGAAVLRSERGEQRFASLDALARALARSLIGPPTPDPGMASGTGGSTAADPADTLAGSLLPVAELFGWLDGSASITPVEAAGAAEASVGWTLDASRRHDGRLLARRRNPEAELRLILDR